MVPSEHLGGLALVGEWIWRTVRVEGRDGRGQVSEGLNCRQQRSLSFPEWQ